MELKLFAIQINASWYIFKFQMVQGSPNFNIVGGERARLGGERAPKARVS